MTTGRTARRSRLLQGTALTLSLLLWCLRASALTSCSASATGVAFGTYNPLSASAAVTTGSLTVNCTLLSGAATAVSLRVDLGSGLSGSYAARTLRSGLNAINYNLYWSTAYTQVWGDGTGGSFYGTASVTLTPGNPTAAVSGTMYARAPAAQDVAAGIYADTIVVTVTY